jgi:hypothetical protein
MRNRYPLAPGLMSFTLMLVCLGCSPAPAPPRASDPSGTPSRSTPTTPKTVACDCTSYPFPNGCDSQCGFTDGVVESVSKDSVTVKVPASQGQAAELKTIPLAALRLEPAALKAGTPVRLTFEKNAAGPLTFKPGAVRSLMMSKPGAKTR